MKLDISKLNSDLNSLDLRDFYYYGFYFGHKLWHHEGRSFSRQCSIRSDGRFINQWEKSDYETFKSVIDKLLQQFDLKFAVDYTIASNTWCGTEGYAQYDICQIRESLSDEIEDEIVKGFHYIKSFLNKYSRRRSDLMSQYLNKTKSIDTTIKEVLKSGKSSIPDELKEISKRLKSELESELKMIKIPVK